MPAGNGGGKDGSLPAPLGGQPGRLRVGRGVPPCWLATWRSASRRVNQARVTGCGEGQVERGCGRGTALVALRVFLGARGNLNCGKARGAGVSSRPCKLKCLFTPSLPSSGKVRSTAFATKNFTCNRINTFFKTWQTERCWLAKQSLVANAPSNDLAMFKETHWWWGEGHRRLHGVHANQPHPIQQQVYDVTMEVCGKKRAALM